MVTVQQPCWEYVQLIRDAQWRAFLEPAQVRIMSEHPEWNEDELDAWAKGYAAAQWETAQSTNS